MELTLNCKKIMDSIPMNENRDILMETLKNEMVANIEANLKRDRELEAEYTSMWSYVKRAEALEADDTTVGARLTSSTSLLSTIAAAGGGGGGGSTGQTDLVWVGPNDVNDLKVRRVCMIFGVDRVPLSDATTMRISYEHLKLPTIHGSPTLKFGFESNSPRPLVALKVIETLETFLSRFRSVHMALLDEIIFEDVAHISMEKALAPSGFASDYTAAMQNPKYSKKTWKDVVQCLNDLFLIDRARLEVFKQLICIRPLSGELVKDFADRIESMYRAAQAEAYGDIVIKAVLASLPISGYRTMERELGDLDHVKNMNVLLTQLRRHPDILDGTQKNPYDFWMKGVHAAPAKKAITAGHAPAPTAAKAITGPSRPATKPPSTSASPGNGSHYSSRHDSARASSPYAPSHYNDSSGHRREHGGKPYDRPPSTFSSDKLCQLPTCVERRLKHRADRCYSVTDPKRYNAMLKGNKHRP
ncbi:hypothetical protein BGZ73_006468 [Actinomortierella ambigua]|nr:hypothetical protein BGZ73_006468 [Actinomortierella ambigua]